MSNIEVRQNDTRTPIEVALDIDESGMTTAKKLYKFLELNPAVYARWAKKEIVNNPYAKENADYFPFNMNVEWGGRATTDYKLTDEFAEKLAMKSNAERGEQVREYFIKVHKALKAVALKSQEVTKEVQYHTQESIELLQEVIENFIGSIRLDNLRVIEFTGMDAAKTEDELEEFIERQVFETFGNPASVGEPITDKQTRYIYAGPKPLGPDLPLEADYPKIPAFQICIQQLQATGQLLQITA